METRKIYWPQKRSKYPKKKAFILRYLAASPRFT